jgi:hypothetical protein
LPPWISHYKTFLFRQNMWQNLKFLTAKKIRFKKNQKLTIMWSYGNL